MLQQCQLTNVQFKVSGAEVAMWRRFGLGLPVVAPEERYRRLLTYRSEKQFFPRECAVTGDSLFSVYAPSSPFEIVSSEFWKSSEFDPLQYGRLLNANRPFIDQLFELWRDIPRPAVVTTGSENSRILEGCFAVSNSFVIFNSQQVKNSAYCVNAVECDTCYDCYNIYRCDRSYELVACSDCADVTWADYSNACSDSAFIVNCVNCDHCFCCSNLDGKSYHVFNRPVTPEEFTRLLAEHQLSARPMFEVALHRFYEFLASQPLPNIITDGIGNNTGNFLARSSDIIGSFFCQDSYRLINCESMRRANNCIDCLDSSEVVDCVNVVGVRGRAERMLNCLDCGDGCSDIYYSALCVRSQNLFGCVGLSDKEHCILNHQYSAEEYHLRRAEIETHLRDRNLWGVMFPVSFAGRAYNRSAAAEHMPLTKVLAQMMGYTWDDEDSIKPSRLLGMEPAVDLHTKFGHIDASVLFAELPEHLLDMDRDAALEAIFLCEISGTPFRMTGKEYDFRINGSLPPPSRGFKQRHQDRLHRSGSHKLGLRKSSYSEQTFTSAFPEKWRQPLMEVDEWRSWCASQA